jgi:hypothetical protein
VFAVSIFVQTLWTGGWAYLSWQSNRHWFDVNFDRWVESHVDPGVVWSHVTSDRPGD